jgi:hypothetical protein
MVGEIRSVDSGDILMPQVRGISSPTTGIYEVISTNNATAFIAFAATLDASDNPVLQIGSCTDNNGGGFAPVLELNCITGVLKLNGVQVVVP